MNRSDIQLSTTGSSENQPPPPKRGRQRGLASFIANNDVVCDITNLQPVDKRASMDKAEKRMTRQHSKHSARGDATAAAKGQGGIQNLQSHQMILMMWISQWIPLIDS